MEGDNNKKREREDDEDDDVCVQAADLFNRAIQTHSAFRSHEAQWNRTIAMLKDRGRAYILKLAQVMEIGDDDPAKDLFEQIYFINRAIGDEPGFFVCFAGGIKMQYSYGSCLWTCKIGSAEAYVVCENGNAKIFFRPGSYSQRHVEEVTKTPDYKEMQDFANKIVPHLAALKTFGIHCVDQDSIMCRDPLYYWKYVLIPDMRTHL